MTGAMDGLTLVAAETPEELDVIREMLREYQDWLNVDLCFQDFENELSSLPWLYAPPQGRLYLVRDDTDQRWAACVALRPREEGRCEMKRLYVRPPWRRRGLGRWLTEHCLREAAVAGYSAMCLDTLSQLVEAKALYASMGFSEVPPYYDNPLEGVTYMEKQIAV